MNFDFVKKKLEEGYYQAPLPVDTKNIEERFGYFSYMTTKLRIFKLELKIALEEKIKKEISDVQFEIFWNLATGIVYDKEKMEKIICCIENFVKRKSDNEKE